MEELYAFKVIELSVGWGSPEGFFEHLVNQKINEHAKEEWVYHDIKVSSSGKYSLIVFKKLKAIVPPAVQ